VYRQNQILVGVSPNLDSGNQLILFRLLSKREEEWEVDFKPMKLLNIGKMKVQSFASS